MNAVSDVRAVLGGALAQNRARTLIAAVAIALGVALGLAVAIVNDSAVNELSQSVRTLSGDADLSVRGPRSGFDEALYARLARDPDIAVASPILEVDVRVAGSSEPLRIWGIDAFRAAAIQPGLVGDATDRLDTLRPDAIFLSNAASVALGAVAEETLTVQGGPRELRLRIAGNLVGAGQSRIGVMDIAAAQVAFDRIGALSRIDLRLQPGVDTTSAAKRLAALLPPGVAIDRPQAASRAAERISRSYRINLNVLALVALFTGGLLVFSTQALAVVRRRTQFALLRTLGITRRRLALLCAFEGCLIGVAGSAAGVIAGYAMAVGAMRIVGSDLGSGLFRGVTPSVDVDPWALLGFFLLGVGAATLGSLVPAFEAARAAPARALKAGDDASVLAKLQSPVPGLALFAVSAGIVFLPPLDGIPVFGYAAIACLLVGTLLLMPRVASALIGRMRSPQSPPAALALAQLRNAPGQASISLASVVASVSLLVSMAIMVTSFRQSLEQWLDDVLPASLYARVAAVDAPLTPDEQARIRALAGIDRAEFSREDQLLLDASRPRVVLIVRPLLEGDAATRLPLVEAPRARPANAPPPVWVNEAMVDLYAFTPGSVVTLPIAGRNADFFVAGVWRDYGRPQGAVQIARDTYVALTDDRNATTAALWLNAGTDVASIRNALRDALASANRVEIAAPGEVRKLSLALFDRTFAVTYALELAAVAIGLVGLSSAFGALVLARRREYGVLRHLGMTRRQVGAMLATEGLVTSVIGVATGLVLGFAISLILIYVVNRQSFHWGMEISIPAVELVIFAGIVVALATLTAVASGRQAMAEDVVRAVKEDW